MMHLLDDVRTGSSDITEYLNASLDHYARNHGMAERSALSEDEQRNAVRHICSQMYQDLSILDSKSNGLIASNSIATAIFAVVALSQGDSGTVFRQGGFIHSAALLFLIPSLIALMLNVLVLSVYWSTTREISESTSVSDSSRNLILIRNRRTRCYRIAFCIHFAVLSGALAILIYALVMSLSA